MIDHPHALATVVCPLHWYTDAAHLEHVAQQMARRGPPILRGHVDVDGTVLLAEGTHRIHAAQRLGVVPRIVPIRWWRSDDALVRARIAATRRGIRFASVLLLGEVGA